MLRHRDVLIGCKFTWVTDHKGLIYLLNQKNLTGRQARWIEKISEFNFEITYIPGSENVLADALSRIYSNDSPGTVRAPSEYTQHDEGSYSAHLERTEISMPVYTALEASAMRPKSSKNSKWVKRPMEKGGKHCALLIRKPVGCAATSTNKLASTMHETGLGAK